MSGTPDTTAGPAVPTADGGATMGGASGGRRRFWSARRVPAGLLALVILAIAGLFLYDIAAVRAHRPGMSWRHGLARQLDERQLDDVWVLTGAAVAAALGLWLLVLALTPGLRSVLTMRRAHPDVRAGLDRDAAATVLRDRALEVAGVQSVRVAVKRKKTDVRAVSHFRDLDDVRDDLTAVLEAAIRGLGLARPSPLSLHVRRPGRKGR
ncbi:MULTISPECIES: DUF6286 domain-containing protein [Streptomyces]|jgi:hypothetical protein|uniref:DUF6286 domain-containing protein n=2 Tax=Streptomyces albogriseolus group TaxID=2867120 RepID=A0ABP6TRE0_9ACTN|nr:hypothetical protein [Streptomyces sp. 2BBP-J2]GHC21896.1 hypothetical protein GCM10010332_61290 [Streptomyces albogriseolus]